MRAASRERRYVTPSIWIERSDMNRRHDCKNCSQIVGLVASNQNVLSRPVHRRGVDG